MFDLAYIWDSLAGVDPGGLIQFIIITFLVYQLLKLVRGTRAVQMTIGILALAFLLLLANWLELTVLQVILRYVLQFAPLAIIVIFQTEIRSALLHLGKTLRNPLTLRERLSNPNENFYEVALAATSLSSRRIGALIVFERAVGLQNHIDTGVKLDAQLTYDLLVTLFDPHTPLHDGAVIMRNGRIAAAGCFLPLTLNPRLSKELGTRHRAAIGVTEDSDCVAVVVSEETGTISFVSGGVITRNLDSGRLRDMLKQSFEPRRPIRSVIPGKRRRRRKKKRKRSDIDTTAEMASEVTSSGT